MSLIGFHRILIATGILFCAGFAVWEVFDFLNGGGPLALLVALAFLLGAGALAYYLRHLSRLLGLERRDGRASPSPER